ncbi:hypothetical protein Dimus_015320 [Dionaea muscipula]
MGKLLCNSTTVADAFQPPASPTPLIACRESMSIDAVDLSGLQRSSTWEKVSGLEDRQRRQLMKLQAKGVLWKHPEDKSSSVVFRLSHGGDVDADGNCLFTASKRAMEAGTDGVGLDPRGLRTTTVRRFLEDLGSANEEEKEMVESAIRHMYSPDLKSGWGIHVVQEVKLLARKADRQNLDSAIDELVNLGMQRELAAKSIYKERGVSVEDGPSWARYMSISGSPDDEYDIITLQYTEDGLLTVDENRQGHAAAFGDDIAIESLATEFKREIYVVSQKVIHSASYGNMRS